MTPLPIQTGPTPPDHRQTALRQAAEDLEANFLSEMLKAARFGETPDTFGGGAGEDQFTSFYRLAVAEKMVKSGGIGLAEQVFQALTARDE